MRRLFGRDARFPSKKSANGWTISLVEYSEKKSAFEILSKPIVFFYFGEEGDRRQDCLCLIT